MLIDKEMFIYLAQKDNSSNYVRDLINQDRLAKADPEFIKLKKRDLQDQLKALGELEKSSKEAPEKVKQILQKWFESFKQNNRMMVEDRHNWIWIKDKIKPELESARSWHYGYEREILEIFQDHYGKSKVLINV